MDTGGGFGGNGGFGVGVGCPIGHHHYSHPYGMPHEYNRNWAVVQERIRIHNNIVAMSQIKFVPPPGAPEGGAWIHEKYVGTKTKLVICCLFFCFFCFACLLLKYPLDERRVYVVAGADGKRQRYDPQGKLLPGAESDTQSKQHNNKPYETTNPSSPREGEKQQPAEAAGDVSVHVAMQQQHYFV